MSTINDGGPAFPMQEPQAIHAYAVAAVDGITDPDERDRARISSSRRGGRRGVDARLLRSEGDARIGVGALCQVWA